MLLENWLDAIGVATGSILYTGERNSASCPVRWHKEWSFDGSHHSPLAASLGYASKFKHSWTQKSIKSSIHLRFVVRCDKGPIPQLFYMNPLHTAGWASRGHQCGCCAFCWRGAWPKQPRSIGASGRARCWALATQSDGDSWWIRSEVRSPKCGRTWMFEARLLGVK